MLWLGSFAGRRHYNTHGVPQITARVRPEAKRQFVQYAASFGLHASELAKLLIVRERYQKRLAKLQETGKIIQRPHRARDDGERPPTITAHFSYVKDVEEFDAYAFKCGFKRDHAAAYLFEAEIGERWLEKAMLICPGLGETPP
jgi:hypothetical protein